MDEGQKTPTFMCIACPCSDAGHIVLLPEVVYFPVLCPCLLSLTFSPNPLNCIGDAVIHRPRCTRAPTGDCSVGYFLPDYTAYAEILGMYARLGPQPILRDNDAAAIMSPEELRRKVEGLALGGLLISNPCNPTGACVAVLCMRPCPDQVPGPPVPMPMASSATVTGCIAWSGCASHLFIPLLMPVPGRCAISASCSRGQIVLEEPYGVQF